MSDVLYPGSCFTNANPVPADTPGDGLELVVVTDKLWDSGQRLRVRYMEGSESQRTQFQQWANEWTQYANIGFEFGSEDPEAEIRVTFRPDLGNWSAVGKDSLLEGFKNEAPGSTMNIGEVTRRVVLHEMGHALGCVHEHQSPAAGIEWDRDVVRRELSQPPNRWDDATIEHNIFSQHDGGLTQFTELDPTSIMMYPIPARWTTNNFSTGFNDTLSARDRSFIAEQYPQKA